MIEWVTLTCPSCKTSLRIRAAYAHLRGRCPECGARIDPVAAQPLVPLPPPVSDEPGLLPVEDEWPEPAQVEEGQHWSYGITSGATADPAAPPVADLDSQFERMDGQPLQLESPDEPAAESYDVMPGHAAAPPVEIHFSGLHVRRTTAKPALNPRWSEILSFPWRGSALAVWLFLTFDFCLLAAVVTALVSLPHLGPVFAALLLVVGLWVGLYAASCFLAVVEETAAGASEVNFPDGTGLIEGWDRLFFLAWVCSCCALPVAFLWQAGQDVLWSSNLWWILPFVLWAIFFPVLLLSAMGASSKWLIVSGWVLGALVRKPHVLLLIWFSSLILTAATVFVGVLLVSQPSFFMPFVFGMVSAAALLCYGRMIGRAGWVLTLDAAGPRPARRPLPRRPVPTPAPPQPAQEEDEISPFI